MLAKLDEVPHPSQRRLGLRLPTRCWALLRGRTRSVYVQVVEVSATGLVLRSVGRQRGEANFLGEQRFELDLFLLGAAAPLHVTLRPVRSIGEFEAFELVGTSAVDRLTLAEHMDRVLAARQRTRTRKRRASMQSSRSLAGAWKRLLLAPAPSPVACSA
jgi:hypothetical protein